MSGFDPLGFRATNWRAVGFSLLFMAVFLTLIVGGIIFFGDAGMNPSNHSKTMRIASGIFFTLLIAGGIAGKIWHMIHTARHADELIVEGERIVGEMKKITPVSQQDQLRRQRESKFGQK